MRSRPLLLTGAALLALQGSAHAQQRLSFTAGVSVRQAHLHTTYPGDSEQLGSTALGAAGTAHLGWLVAELEYFETNLRSRSGPAVERGAVEGELMVGATPLPWLTLVTGPHARAFDTPLLDVVERWMLWEVRARARLGVVPRVAEAYVELRRVLAADVNVDEDFSSLPNSWSSGLGGEAGITFGPPGRPLFLQVGYRFERYSLDDGTRVDVSDGVVVSVGVRR